MEGQILARVNRKWTQIVDTIEEDLKALELLTKRMEYQLNKLQEAKQQTKKGSE